LYKLLHVFNKVSGKYQPHTFTRQYNSIQLYQPLQLNFSKFTAAQW